MLVPMTRLKVTPMVSPRTGKAVVNQYIINTEHGEVFQSYDSVICIKFNDGSVVLDEKYWNYSVTTDKYRSQFLGEGTHVTRKKIGAGIYQTANLNSL